MHYKLLFISILTFLSYLNGFNASQNTYKRNIDKYQDKEQVPEHKIKAALILNISKFIEWPNENEFKKYSILIIDDDTLIYNEIRKVQNTYSLNGKTFEVHYNSSITQTPEKYQIIFLGESKSNLLNKLYQSVSGKGVLLYTDNEKDKILTMVNLYYNAKSNNISFEINKQSLEENGFVLNPKLIALGGSFIDLKNTYLKTYQQLTKEKQNLEKLKNDLKKLSEEKTRIEREAIELNQKIKTLTINLQRTENEYQKLSVKIQNKDSLLRQTTKELAEKNAERNRLQQKINSQISLISSSKKELDSLNRKIAQTQAVLTAKQDRIKTQNKIIDEKEGIIAKQQKRYYILIFFLFGLFLSLLFATWAYRIKRNMNIKLEKEVLKRTRELNISRQHFQSLFDNAPIAMFEMDLSQLYLFLSDFTKSNNQTGDNSKSLGLEEIQEAIRLIRITNINKKGYELFGFKNLDDANINYINTFTHESLISFEQVIKTLAKREQFFNYQSIRRSLNGNELYLILKWIALPGYTEDYSKVLVTSIDITKLKKYEQELKMHKDHLEDIVKERTQEIIDLNNELKESNEELLLKTEELEQTVHLLEEAQNQLVQQEKMASLGMLTAGIAHEINNPINFISGSQQAIGSLIDELWNNLNRYKTIAAKHGPNHFGKEKNINSNEDEEIYSSVKMMLNNIETGIDRTTAIIRSLKTFVHADNTTIQEVSIQETLRDVLNMLQGLYKNHVEIVKHIQQDLPTIKCPSNQLHQVLMNILTNAIDAIENEGKIEITAEYLKKNQSIILKIKDTGTGIPEEIKEKIFDPFFTTKEVGKGTGLGLYITYNIIKSLNGNIDVSSSRGKGTEFIITLPTS